jgi:hypothetical protein
MFKSRSASTRCSVRLPPAYQAWIILAALPAAALSAEFTFEIPPVPVSLNIAGQAVAVTISGNISESPARPGESEQSFNLNLRADLADLQNHLTALLRAELNQANRCGERISVESATLVPAAPTGRLTIELHFEKWACFKAFGKENAKKLVGGNGTVRVILSPRVEQGNTVRLDAEMGSIEADGSLGEVLRSGSVGAAMRDKIREALLKAIQSADLGAVVPVGARPFVTIESAVFPDEGGGRLALNLAGWLLVPRLQVSSVLEQFRNRR